MVDSQFFDNKSEILKKYFSGRDNSGLKKCEIDEKCRILQDLLEYERIKFKNLSRIGKFTEEILKTLKEDSMSEWKSGKSFKFPIFIESNIFENLYGDFYQNFCIKFQILTKKLNNYHKKLNILLEKKGAFKTIADLKSELDLARQYLKKLAKDKQKLEETCESLKIRNETIEKRFIKNTSNLETQLKSNQNEIKHQSELISSLETEICQLKKENSKYIEEEKASKSLKEAAKHHKALKNLKAEEDSIQSSKNAKLSLEKLLISNLLLKGEILELEGKNQASKGNESIISDHNRESISNKTLKEISFKKKPDSEDSLDLNINNIKEVIEIHELKEALRTISERYELDKFNILKDCENSRQDMEIQIFRLRQEKAYTESINKDLRQALSEIYKEKEDIENQLSKYKLKISTQESKSLLNPPKPEPEIASSVEFDLTHSIDTSERCNTLPIKNFQEDFMHQFNEISLQIKKNKKEDLTTTNTIDLMKDTLSHMIKIKEIIDEETSMNSICKGTSKNLSDIVSKLKFRVKTIEDESIILKKQIDKSDFDPPYTEPCIRFTDRDNNDLVYYYKKKLQIEKSKIFEKKHVIGLHKEQIAFLKQNIRDLQAENTKLKAIDVQYITDLFKNFIKSIPIMPLDIEKMVEIIMEILSVSQTEFEGILSERKSKKFKRI